GLDQPAERDTRRAGRLAAPALHARLQRPDERGVRFGAVPLDLAHGGHPAPGRQGLLARDPVGRAVGQAEAAGHAGGELVVDDAEVHHAPSTGSRPGPSRPVGSNTVLIRRWSCATGASTGRAGCGSGRWTIPTPTWATNDP